jgi:hypothetical protein
MVGILNMSLSDVAALAGVVSSLAVLVSLVYLALQIRQAAHNQRAETQASVTARRVDFLMRIAEPGMAEVAMLGAAGDPVATPLQSFQYISQMQAALTNWEDEFFQHRNGMLDERRYRLQLAVNRDIFALPGARAVWRLSKTNFDPDFVAHMDAIVQSAQPQAQNLIDAWRAVAAEERAAATS